MKIKENTIKLGERFCVICGTDEDREISKQDIVKAIAKIYSKKDNTSFILAIACAVALLAVALLEIFIITNLSLFIFLLIDIISAVIICSSLIFLLVKLLKNYSAKEKERNDILDILSHDKIEAKIYTCTYKWTEIREEVRVRPGRNIPIREIEIPVYHLSFNKKYQFTVNLSTYNTVKEDDKLAFVTLGDGTVHCAYLVKTCKFEFPVKTEAYEET